jgi:hypothetical protein
VHLRPWRPWEQLFYFGPMSDELEDVRLSQMVPRSASTTSSAWRLAHWPPARNVTDPRSVRWPELPGLGVQPVRYSEQRRLLRRTSCRLSGSPAMMLGLAVFSGQGFGLGVAVVLDRSAACLTRCKGASARCVGLARSAAGGRRTLPAGRCSYSSRTSRSTSTGWRKGSRSSSMTPSPIPTSQRPLHMGGAARLPTSDAETSGEGSVCWPGLC